MILLRIFSIILLIILPNCLIESWSTSVSAGNDNFYIVSSVVYDNKGDLILSGWGSASSNDLINLGSIETSQFIQKFSDAKLVWTLTIKSLSMLDTVVDSQGNIIAFFNFGRTIILPSVDGRNNATIVNPMQQTNSSPPAGILVKYSKDGNLLGWKLILAQLISDIEIDYDDGVIISGRRFKVIYALNSDSTSELSYTDDHPTGILKIRDTGQSDWLAKMSNANPRVCRVDGNGAAIVVLGDWRAQAQLKSGGNDQKEVSLSSSSSSNGAPQNLFLARYSSSDKGIVQWALKIMIPSNGQNTWLDIDSTGAMVVYTKPTTSYSLYDSANSLVYQNTKYGSPILIKYDAQGLFKWTVSISREFRDARIKFTPADNLMISSTNFIGISYFDLFNSINGTIISSQMLLLQAKQEHFEYENNRYIITSITFDKSAGSMAIAGSTNLGLLLRNSSNDLIDYLNLTSAKSSGSLGFLFSIPLVGFTPAEKLKAYETKARLQQFSSTPPNTLITTSLSIFSGQTAVSSFNNPLIRQGNRQATDYLMKSAVTTTKMISQVYRIMSKSASSLYSSDSTDTNDNSNNQLTINSFPVAGVIFILVVALSVIASASFFGYSRYQNLLHDRELKSAYVESTNEHWESTGTISATQMSSRTGVVETKTDRSSRSKSNHSEQPEEIFTSRTALRPTPAISITEESPPEDFLFTIN